MSRPRNRTGVRSGDVGDDTLLVGAVAVVLLVVGSVAAAGLVVVVGGIALLTFGFLLAYDVLPRLRSNEAVAGEEPSTPVEELRERYVAGEFDETEFERRLEALLNDDRPVERAAAEPELER